MAIGLRLCASDLMSRVELLRSDISRIRVEADHRITDLHLTKARGGNSWMRWIERRAPNIR